MKRAWRWLYYTEAGAAFMALLSIVLSVAAIAVSITTMALGGHR